MEAEPSTGARGQGATSEAALVRRRRLVEGLAGASAAAPTVATVVAPAGYGKTTLLRCLAEESGAGEPVLVSLAECEQHPALFLDLLAAAARRRFPRADLRPLLQLETNVPAAELGERLLWVLSRIVEEAGRDALVLLLDDVQELEPGEPLTELVGALLAAEPRRLRYVLASRRRVPFELAAHRRVGVVLELTGADLAFTQEETGLLLARAMGRAIPGATCRKLHERTRGWPALLAAFCTVVRGRADEELSALVAGLSGEEEAIVEFVVGELLAEYSSPVRYFVKVVSVLDRVELGVARALFGAGGRGASRHLISLPEQQIQAYLTRLEETQVLVPSPGGVGLEFNPLVCAALRRLLEREEPRLYREAHRRVAAWYRRAGGPVDSASLDHLVAAGEFDSVLALLESEAERFFASGYHRQLSRWLTALERHYAALPFWACYYLGRVYAGRGEWDRARAYLDRCKSELGARGADAADPWRWQPMLCLGYAVMYWRRGMQAEASTYCRRGTDYLRQLRRRQQVPEGSRVEAARIELDLTNLLGHVKMETGVYDKADAVCREARDLARAEGLEREEATALRNLGLIATRRGAVREAIQHLEEALERANAEQDPELHAMIAYRLGAAHLLDGRLDAARELVTEALGRLVDAGRPATIVQVLATLGSIHAAAGDLAAADEVFRRALRFLDDVGDVKVRAEVLDRYAIYLARQGRVDESRLMLDRAAALVGGVLRSEVHLAALHAEAMGEHCAAAGDREKAIQRLGQAVERYARIGAGFHVARLTWRMGLWHHQRFVAAEEDTPEPVLEALDRVCGSEAARGIPRAPASEALELLHIGIAYGGDEVADRCRQALERAIGELPAEVGVRAIDEHAAARYRDYRRRAELADDYVIVGRDGRRGANARQVEELIGARGEEALILLSHDQLMINRGEEVSLAEKRVIMPLLLHFLRHPEEVFTMDQLARSVWKSRDAKQAMQTKVKVAISRLRALLGKDRPYVITTRIDKPSGTGTIVAYGLAPELEFFVVERMEDDELD